MERVEQGRYSLTARQFPLNAKNQDLGYFFVDLGF